MKINTILVASLLLAVVFSVLLAGCASPPAPKPPQRDEMTGSQQSTGYCGDPDHGSEPSTTSITVALAFNGSVDNRVEKVTFTLKWTEDETDAHPPADTFEMDVSGGSNTTDTATGNSGKLEISFEAPRVSLDDTVVPDGLAESWNVDITISDCGYDKVGPFGFLIYPDHGNSFTLDVSYQYSGVAASIGD